MALAVNCEATGKPGVCDTHMDEMPVGGVNPVAALVKASTGKKLPKPKKLSKKEQAAADKAASIESDYNKLGGKLWGQDISLKEYQDLIAEREAGDKEAKAPKKVAKMKA